MVGALISRLHVASLRLGLAESFDKALAAGEPLVPIPVEPHVEVAPPSRAQAADLFTLARMPALRLMYGRGPDR